MMNLTQVSEWLLSEGYMVQHKGQYCLTQAFYQAVGQTPPVKVASGMKEQYQAFLEACKIPYRLPIGNKGDTYTVGAYSLPGEKAFTIALKTPGLDYQRLVEATKAHYNDPRATRHTITKYFVEKWWVGIYENYKHSTPKAPVGIEL